MRDFINVILINSRLRCHPFITAVISHALVLFISELGRHASTLVVVSSHGMLPASKQSAVKQMETHKPSRTKVVNRGEYLNI